MRRIVATGVTVAFLLGLVGCGGTDEGMPTDADMKQAKSIAITKDDMMNKMKPKK
jgi:hypothetical protein